MRKSDSYSYAVFNKSEDRIKVYLDLSRSKKMKYNFEKGVAVKVNSKDN